MTIPSVIGTAIQLGDSPIQENNFIVCVSDNPDGTLTIKRGDGTVVATIDAAGKVVFAGNAQTWQSVTRASGVQYTNTTAFPITCNITFFASASAATLTASVAGVTVVNSNSPAAGVSANVSLTVPTGANYSLTVTGSGTATMVVMELR